MRIFFLTVTLLLTACNIGNKNAPPIFKTLSAINVSENQIFVANIDVMDPDNDQITISISGKDASYFVLTQDNQLNFVTAPDYETKQLFSIVLTASDSVLMSSLSVEVTILNENDNVPVILPQPDIFLSHNQKLVASISATDLDGDSLTYNIDEQSAALMIIDESSGDLEFIDFPDFDTHEQFEVNVSVFDGEYYDSIVLYIFQKVLTTAKIDTFGSEVLDDPKILAYLELIQDNEIVAAHNIGIEIRGTGSQLYDKKSYGFETRDVNNEDVSVPLVGLPKEEDWIFYGPYVDKALIRNILLYDLSNAIGRYAARGKFIELIINDSNLGTYILMEKLKRDSNRIAIKKNKEDDISGGYILKIDKPTGDGGTFTDLNSFTSIYPAISDENPTPIVFLYDYPKAEDITEPQKAFIQRYIEDFETALATDNFLRESRAYEDFIDTDSFIDFFLLTELANNVDGYRRSTFLHKDRGGKLNMGPIWDFNLGFGKAQYCNGDRTNVWAYQFNSVCPFAAGKVPFWWEKLLEDHLFVDKLKKRWNELKESHFSYPSIESRIDDLVLELEQHNAVHRDAEVWSPINPHGHLVFDNHLEEITYLKAWINQRLAWLDENINQL